MLRPQELKEYEFTRVLRGYSADEVDEYIEYAAEKYGDLYREHDELRRKLAAALRALDDMKRSESKRASLDDDAKRAAARILAEAEQQKKRILADAEREKKRIVADAEEYADRILADADERTAAQKETLADMQRSVLAFRDDLFRRYSAQIDEIEAMAAAAEAILPSAGADGDASGDEAVKIYEPDEPGAPEEAEEIEEPDEIEEIDEPEVIDEPAEPEEVAEPAEPEDIEEPEESAEPEESDEPEEIGESEESAKPEEIEKSEESDGPEESAEPAEDEEHADPLNSDDALLRELQRAFHVEFENFHRTERPAEPVPRESDEDEFTFLDEDAGTEDEKRGLFSRLTRRGKKSNKK